MPKKKIEGLLSQLHEKLTDNETSPEQELMLAQMQSQLASWDGPQPADGNLLKTIELLLFDIEETHPKAAIVAKDIVEALKNIF